MPSFVSKNISTDIVSKAGNVIALGGRMHTETVNSRFKIPLLGDLPLIGWLFRSSNDSVRAKDLIFFLVPEIVDGNIELDESDFYNNYKEQTQRHWDSVEAPTQLELQSRIESLKDDIDKEEMIVEPEEESNSSSVEVKNEEEQILVNEALEKEEIEDNTSATIEDEIVQIESQEDQNRSNELNVTSEPLVEPVVETNSTQKEDTKEEFVVIQESNATKPIKKSQENSVTKKEKKSPQVKRSTLYSVTQKEVYLRSEAGEGFRIDSWERGHKFKSDAQKEVNGALWLKISQDCAEGECEDVDVPLWIEASAVKDKENASQSVAPQESSSTNSLQEGEGMQEYAVSVRRIFLRDAPNNGKKVTIWGENHPFKSSEEKVIGKTTWVNVVEDCRPSCKKLDEPLWVAKKYIKEAK